MRTRSALLIAVMAMAVLAVPGVAVAQDRDQAVLVILDVSGSMDREGEDGTTLLDAARSAVTDLVDTIPDEIPVGLRLYGHQVGEDAPRPEQCRDTELVLGLGEASTASLPAVLEPLEPLGRTPIGRALRQAGSDVAGADQATVILVSDGEANCRPPGPCAAARELADAGVEVVVDTVGLLLDTDRAEDELACIAEATGGTFVTADDASSLTTALQESSTRAERRYEVSGEPIAGAAVPFEAPEMEPGTQYVDEVRGDETLFYAIDELGPGDTFDVEIVREGVPGRDGYFRAYSYLVDRDDRELGWTTCCTGQDLDTAQVTALRDVEIPEDVDQAFMRVVTDVASGADPAQLQRLQIRVVPTGASATASPSPQASPTASPSPSPSPSPDPTASPSPEVTDTPSPVETVTVASTDSSDDAGVPTWLLAVVAVLALALVGMAVWIVQLQRRSARPAGGSSEPPPPPPTAG